MDVQDLRRQIPAARTSTYMNTGWSGPTPLPVLTAVQEHLQWELEHGAASPKGIQRSRETTARTRQALAKLLGVSPHEIIPTQNTTMGLSLAAGGLPWRPGDGVVTCSLEHPSPLAVAHGIQRRWGARLDIVQLHPGDDAEAILTKLNDAVTPGVRLAVLSHVEYSTGLRLPLKEIVALAHDRGVQVLVDGAQSAGCLDLDLRDLGVDYYALPGQKWLLGPSGTGALYVREDLIPGLSPVAGSYRSLASWEADGSVIFKEGELDKLLAGTQSAALMAGLEAAVRFVTGVGLAEVQERTLALAARLKAALAAVPGVSVVTPEDPDLSAGLVACAVPGHDPAAVADRLWTEHRVAARSVQHPDGVRFSVAFFNTEEEADAATETLRVVLEG